MRVRKAGITVRLCRARCARAATCACAVVTRTAAACVGRTSHFFAVALDHLRQHSQLVKQVLDRQVAVKEFGGMVSREAALQKDCMELALGKTPSCMAPHLSVARRLRHAVGLYIAEEEHILVVTLVCNKECGRIEWRWRAVDRNTSRWLLSCAGGRSSRSTDTAARRCCRRTPCRRG